ncbi:DEAD/DEAH box helicase [Bhargavaea beijingensis]|uniref:DEAD-box ATP-dependent RNA helicase CshB n=1 Tax=Bhargavaea beijingensis TaxID=426756 RepID=A0A1G7CSI9_9BACL|nr:DEAD/DEAH box helicase [Bhargavaea beijingensis]MCW1927102.1 DEAD/DEAH box helicase [Bhargavaea beijingensis]RSK30828.1 DEAD/DEAH box helicase [Bhargavaea beijingensis]SDE42277.1 ATP-dependent RNA helicase CshB [Bhargavaea beijingensis]
MLKFTEMKLQPFLQDAIRRIGFEAPTPVQESIIPLMLAGKSAIGQAHTGTGKTHSFLIPIVERINPDADAVQAVIAAPTRELAEQIHSELLKLTEGTSIRSGLFMGGTDKQRSIDKLKTQPQVAVGTPGRLRDLVQEDALLAHTANVLVIDEADLAFDMGYIEDIDQVASRMPKDLEMYVFSATIPEKLKPFLNKYMESPEHVRIGERRPVAEGIEFPLVPVRSMDRKKKLLLVMEGLNPYLAIIFTNTRKEAEEVGEYLSSNGIKTGRIHGDLTPRERRKMMNRVRDLEFEYIVATDLASRGIDIPGVSHVINYNLPEDLEFFIHRSGRTARAGLQGTVITLYEPSDDDAIVRIEKMGVPFVHRDVKNGEWIELKERHARSTRQKTDRELDEKIRRQVRKPSKVKPGYKKKIEKQVADIRRKEKRKELRQGRRK